eukprot:COSAG01_NODE_1597_length_9775_cov_6.997210_6_plen_108_part_00
MIALLCTPAESGGAGISPQKGGDTAAESALAALPIDDRDAWACTALHLACRQLHPRCAAALLHAGADVRTPNSHGRTPLDELEKGARAFLSFCAQGGKAVLTVILPI